MKSAIRTLVSAGLIATAVAAHAGVTVLDDNNTVIQLDTLWTQTPPSGTAPWAGLLLRDFDGSSFDPPYDYLTRAVELQITVDPALHAGPPPNDGFPVQGYGNLTGQESMSAVVFNLNPALDVTKLNLRWTGANTPDLGFPSSGIEPTLIGLGSNFINQAGARGSFDILIRFDDGGLKQGDWSKLVFTYDDPTVNLNAEDFQFPGGGEAAGYIAAGFVSGIASGTGRGWIATQVPEPETYAMMLAGGLFVGYMVRRRSRTG